MAKTKVPPSKSSVRSTQKQAVKGSQLDYLNIDVRKTRYIFIGIIVLALLIFFKQGIFEGKIFASADNLSPLSFKTFLDDAKAQGVFPLWVPYIFMGMPSLASLTAALPSIYNIFSYVWDKIFEAFSGGNLFFLTVPYYFIFAISLFFYARYKFKNLFVALYCALMGVFATGIIQLIIVGHHTKMMTFAFVPLIMLYLDKLIESEDDNKFRIIMDFGLLTTIVFLQLHFHHIQMLFYSYMMIGIYTLYTLVYRLIKKQQVTKIIRAVALLIIAVLFSIAMDADIILSVKEYNKYSMRGESSIVSKSDPAKTQDKPLSYEYATNWSFSPGEVLTFIIPHYYGFGTVEIDNGQRTNLYWGQMPFTDSPVYFGVITFLLAFVGIFLNFRKNHFVQVLSLIVLFFLFLSFGRTLPLIYNIFFYNVPYFSSFRAPVMIHYYIDLIFLILAGFGLKDIIDMIKTDALDKKLIKLSYVLFAIGGIMLLISVFGFENSYSNEIANSPLVDRARMQGASAQQISNYVRQVSSIAYKNVVNDLMLHAFLILIVTSLIYFYARKKISLSFFMIGVIIIALFDILNVSAKTLHWDEKSQKDSYFAETDYSKWLLSKEPDTYQYRVAEFNKGSLATSNNLAYFRLHSFNGYQGAKIRIYQDAVDVAGGDNPFLLGLANVKYLISDGPLKDTVNYKEVYKASNIVYQNKLALPRAFFVSEYKVEQGIDILNHIRDANFNPLKTAFLEKEINKKIDIPDSNVYAKISSFNIHKIEYDVNASGNNFLVLDEIYYPAGWKAYVDGNETEFYKTNYILRGIIVPAGKHKIEMVYHPDTYFTGRNISLTMNIILLIVLVVGTGGYYMKKKKEIVTG